MPEKEGFLYLSESDVLECLTPGDVAEIVEDLWKSWKTGEVEEGVHSFLSVGKGNEFLHMPVRLSGIGIAGFKWIPCYMNPLPGYPFSHDNLVVLNDMATGSLKAIVSAAPITAMRTAGGHGVVAARYLSGGPVKSLSVIGSGKQAAAGIEGFLSVFPELSVVRVYCRKTENWEQISARFSGRVQMVRESLDEIGKNTNVILVATSSPDILLKADQVEPGTTVIALDGFIDVDPVLAQKADKWYVGSRKSDVEEIIESGIMSHGVSLDETLIFGELPDVVSGRLPGRERREEVILYTHMGAGAYDVACAFAAYQKALNKNRGVWLSVK